MNEDTKSKMVKSLCLISFMSNASFSQMSPFYPLKAAEKGVTPVYVGFVFGTMAVAQMVSSFMVGKCMHNFGSVRHYVIMTGTLFIIMQTAGLGYIDNVEDEETFLRISFIS